MPTATLTTVDAILKEVYGPRIESQLQDETVALKRIERSSEGVVETVGGKYVDFPIKVGRNHGIGYRDENTQLPNAGRQKYAEVHVPLRYGYGRVRMTGQLMQLADKNHQAFASAMDSEMDGLKNDIAKDSNRIVYGDGTGKLATVTADGANTVTVDSIQRLELDMMIDIALTASPHTALAADRTIDAIDESTKVVTYSGGDVAATTSYSLFRQGSAGKEPSGLGTIVSATTTLHGLAPGTEPKWKAIVRGNSGTNRALSEGLMIETTDLVRVNGGKTSLILTGLGVRRAYFNLLSQQRRYTDTKEFAGGFTGLAFNNGTEIPVVEDPDAPPNTMFFLSEKDFKVYRSREWHWADDDGNVLKWVHDYDAWEAIMRCYWELGVSRRNTQAVLQDITEG